MPISESSYADRRQRGRTIVEATKTLNPPFAPADASLEPAPMELYLKKIDEVNYSIATALADWKATVAHRIELVAQIKSRVLRANSRVKSNPAWATHAAGIKTLADRIRGQRLTKPKPPADSAAPAAPTRESGDQSYADIKNGLDLLTTALKKINGYDATTTTALAEITVASLEALATKLHTHNDDISRDIQTLTAARSTRITLYDGPTGLTSKLKGIKESVKSQYGSTSPQYLQIRPIRV